MPEWQPLAPAEIDYKLRQDFNRRLEDYGVRQEETDPMLAVLFRSFAAQVGEVYERARMTIPLAVLDELMTGLGMPERRAQAAQAVVKFTVESGQQTFEAETLLIGEAEAREKLTFALDTALVASTAQLALVAVYKEGTLRLHQGTELSKDFREARPAPEAVPAELGPTPALYIAVDVEEALHLSQHGFYLELDNDAGDLLAHLKREVWCLMDEEGGIRPEGLLRPQAANAGVRKLEWMVGGTATGESTSAMTDEALLADGFYGNRVFLFPEVPPDRRFLVTTPRKMEIPLRRIFQATERNVLDCLFAKKRAWLRIGLPPEATTVTEDLRRVMLHCTTASNEEVLNHTVRFDRQGLAVPTANSGTRAKHLIGVISIKGEHGTAYLHETEPSADDNAGRFRIRQSVPTLQNGNAEDTDGWRKSELLFRQGWLEIRPAQTLRGVVDGYANVRLLHSNGRLGNAIDAGKITTLLNRATPRMLKITNVNRAAGGTDGESYDASKQRFTTQLLSRERPVTLADLEATIKAFEPKIRAVKTNSALERCAEGLRRVQQVTVCVERDSFALPETEAPILQRELQAELQQRSLFGLDVRVEIEWL